MSSVERKEEHIAWAILGAILFWVIAWLVVISFLGVGGYATWDPFVYFCVFIQPVFGVVAILSWIIAYFRAKKRRVETKSTST